MHPCVEIFWLWYILYRFVFFCTYLFQSRIAFLNSRKTSYYFFKTLQENFGNLATVNIFLTQRFVLLLSEGVWRQRTWWRMWKWISNPLTNVWDQSSHKLTSILFAGLPCARNRSLDWDLFCGGSRAKLPSTLHAHKMGYRLGIIIYATSHSFNAEAEWLWLMLPRKISRSEWSRFIHPIAQRRGAPCLDGWVGFSRI